MAFLLHVDFTTPNAESSATVLEQLRVMASVQGPHRGMVTYCFFHPDEAAAPTHLEFLEVYDGEATFWAHATDPKVRAGAGKWAPVRGGGEGRAVVWGPAAAAR